MAELLHPIHDIGPELLNYAMERMDGIIQAMRATANLPAKSLRRVEAFEALITKFELVMPELTRWCNAGAFPISEPNDMPELKIKQILFPDGVDDESALLPLYELSTACTNLLARTPTAEAEMQMRNSNLPVMLTFYQISHSIIDYFSKVQ